MFTSGRIRQLAPAELETAISHAVQTHHLAERERARLSEATDLDTLRVILRDAGLPGEDIEAAIDTLPQALRDRQRGADLMRQRRERLRRIVLGVIVAGAVAAALVAPLSLGRSSGDDAVVAAPVHRRMIAPTIEPTVEEIARATETPHIPREAAAPPHAVVAQAPQEIRLTEAEARHVAAETLRTGPTTVLESLEPAQTVAIAEGRAAPLTALFPSDAPAQALVVTHADCTSNGNLGALLGDTSGAVSMESVRGHVEAMRIDVTTGKRLAGETVEATALHISATTACRKALADAARKLVAVLDKIHK